MGYETQLIVGRATDNEFQGKRYFMEYAAIDMCKMGSQSALYDLDWCNKKDSDEPVWEFYPPGGDGDTGVSVDRYGDVPKPIPIDLVIEALQKDAEREDYHRVRWAIALLTSIRDTTNDTSVLLWGH